MRTLMLDLASLGKEIYDGMSAAFGSFWKATAIALAMVAVVLLVAAVLFIVRSIRGKK